MLKLHGADGVLVDVPVGAKTLEGPDGRLVVIPTGCKGIVDDNGRMQAVCPDDHLASTGSDKNVNST